MHLLHFFNGRGPGFEGHAEAASSDSTNLVLRAMEPVTPVNLVMVGVGSIKANSANGPSPIIRILLNRSLGGR